MKIRVIIFALVAIMVSCSTTTKITGSWKADDYKKEKEFKKIAVVTLAQNNTSQLVVEKSFIDRLKYLGYDAIPTSDFLVGDVIKKENAQMIDEMFKKREVDAVIILSLLKIKDETRYVQGSTMPYGPGGYYGGYYGYYYHNYNRMNDGYYEETTSIFLESKFYDLDKGKLISSIQTETSDPAGIDDLSQSFSQAILKRLVTDKILVNNSVK